MWDRPSFLFGQGLSGSVLCAGSFGGSVVVTCLAMCAFLFACAVVEVERVYRKGLGMPNGSAQMAD